MASGRIFRLLDLPILDRYGRPMATAHAVNSPTSPDFQRRLFREIPARPVLVHPRLVESLGVRAALLICQLAYWQARVQGDRFVYKTEAELREETGLSENEQRTAITKLVSLGILAVHRRDLFGRRNFRLEIGPLLRFVENWKSGSSIHEPEDYSSTTPTTTPLPAGPVPGDDAEKYPSTNQSANTEMTAESTAENTSERAAELARNARALDRVRADLTSQGIIPGRDGERRA